MQATLRKVFVKKKVSQKYIRDAPISKFWPIPILNFAHIPSFVPSYNTSVQWFRFNQIASRQRNPTQTGSPPLQHDPANSKIFDIIIRRWNILHVACSYEPMHISRLQYYQNPFFLLNRRAARSAASHGEVFTSG